MIFDPVSKFQAYLHLSAQPDSEDSGPEKTTHSINEVVEKILLQFPPGNYNILNVFLTICPKGDQISD